MFFRKKPKKVQDTSKKKIKRETRLTVWFEDGTYNSWTSIGWDRKTFWWKHFYKWFFSRSGEYYVMRYTTGQFMFLRKNIVKFAVEEVEV